MCETRSDAFTRPATSRRTFLTVGAAGTGAVVLSSLPGAAQAAKARGRSPKRAYVLVVDGCRPDEISDVLTPNLAALRAGGRNYPTASSVPIMETIPNHVMMMAGVFPDRTGVPANSFYDPALGAVRTMDRPSDVKVQTVIERLNGAGLTTGTVLSKEYLYGVFGDRATHRWEPAPVIPVSGHAPDAATMDATLAMIDQHDPNLVFVNLGDIDRFGHSDLTGPYDLKAARRLALTDTDQQVKRFVDHLKATGRWKNSIVVVLADHSMDWSVPGNLITLQDDMDADPMLAGKVAIADQGGADLLYWLGADAERDAAIARMRQIALASPGVLSAQPRTSLPLGPEAGDVVVYCKAGWRFSEPDPFGNPIPGNHGHPATLPIPFFIGGGSSAVRKGTSSSAQALTLDVAPTLSAYFGVGGPSGGYDGASRL
ncbi:alkaline phosphatase family protein [Nocardioides sp. GCM10027113]|uniref:alkaline phosphatase family protein n=1 Tax=unclassified Nocardioides TaxID=2615069 RepID=UPI00362418D2